METKNAELSALQDIRNIMDRSTRFLSLSGLSGVWAGAVALAGGICAYMMIEARGEHLLSSYQNEAHFESTSLQTQLLLLAACVFVLALAGAVFFTRRKVRKAEGALWTAGSKRFVMNLFVPFATGTAMVLAFILNGDWQYVTPASLVFYGISLYNGGKFTLTDIRYLGIVLILSGLVNLAFPDAALYFWIFGFGIMHIIYGILMWRKYDCAEADKV